MKILDLKEENACQFIEDVMEYNKKFSSHRWPQSTSASNYSIEYSSLGVTDLVGVKNIEDSQQSCRVIFCQ